MKRRLAYLPLAAAAVLAAQDYTPIAPEPRGWSKAVWGMTVAELRAALPEAAPLPRPEPDLGTLGRLQLPAVDFGPVRAIATFQFDPAADRLVAIRLEADPKLPKASTFALLRDALVEKYGRPTSEENTTDHTASGSRITTHTVQWNRRYTVIRLNWYDAGDIGIVSARYSERKNLDSL